MATIVGAGTGGVITAIVMIFEMTRDYSVILPMVVAVGIGSGVRRALLQETIFTIRLRRHGRRIPEGRHANLFLIQQADSVMTESFVMVESGASLTDGRDLKGLDGPHCGSSRKHNNGRRGAGLWRMGLRSANAKVDYGGNPSKILCASPRNGPCGEGARAHGSGANGVSGT
ncbi:chloride channel protein [Methylocystis parvus]|uniref:Chloride channel protein n=2 Tax=Methylocystis parvus TaxID=134 RepID=A0A6B8MBY2_9HYPH|nr:hypothetical protein F7D14_21570 [Methylocystis parvus]